MFSRIILLRKLQFILFKTIYIFSSKKKCFLKNVENRIPLTFFSLDFPACNSIRFKFGVSSMFRVMLPSSVWCVVLLGCCFTCVSAQEDTCYTSGSIAGIVIATVVVTLVTAGLAAAFIWYLWRQRKGKNLIFIKSQSKTKKKIFQKIAE